MARRQHRRHNDEMLTELPSEADFVIRGRLAGFLTDASPSPSNLPGVNPSGISRSSSPRSQWRGRAGFSPASRLSEFHTRRHY